MTKTAKYSLYILVILHSVGVYLFIYSPEAANLSYITLGITAALLIINEKSIRSIALPISITLIGGFIIELIGTKTGLLFGDYRYGNSLGPKLYGVPLVIGLNWVVIVRSSLELVERYLKSPRIIVAILTGGICTLLDLLIEPVAIANDFWTWTNNSIPVFNYITWFIFSSIFAFIMLYFQPRNNKLGIPIFITWLLFFIILNLI